MRTRSWIPGLVVALGLIVAPRLARAIDGPSPGAVSASKVKLPDGPGSVRGLADNASVEAASAQVTYAIPIELPTSGGLAPSITLSYRGELGNGPVGVGWSLAHAAIRRSTRHGVPRFDDSDELEIAGIGGGRLIRIDDGTYRVEGAGNAIRAVRAGNRWTVTDSDGTVYYFGLTENGRQEATTSSGALRTAAWFPELVVHLNQRTIAYEYLHDRGQVYLAAARWGDAYRYRVEIAYQPRADVTTSYREGFEVVTAQRASSIRVASGTATLRRYTLAYDTTLPLSRLASVSMTGFDDEGALPPVTFTYAGRSAEPLAQLPGLDGWRLESRGVSFADVDGDGADDLLRLEAGNHAFRKNLGGSFGPMQPLTGAEAIELAHAQLLDLDGDARVELVRVVNDTWRAYRLDSATRQWRALGIWPGTDGIPLGGARTVLADLNGDGRTDVVRGTATGILVNFNGPTGLGATQSLPRISVNDVLVEPGVATVRFTEVNGDGLADVVWMTDGWMKQFLGRGDGTFVPWRRVFYPWGAGGATVLDPANVRLADLDRDGLVDLIRFTAGHVVLYPALPDGQFATPRAFARPESADVDVVVTLADANGNGSLDVVWSSPRGMWCLDLAGPTSAGMLASIDNGLGQVMSFTYAASAKLAIDAGQAGQPWAHQLPVSIAVPVRTETTISGSPTRTTQWGVRDGLWDVVERRFGGFLETRTVIAGPTARDTAVTIARLHPGLGTDRVLRGKPTTVRVENGLGELQIKTETTWEAYRIASLPDQPLLHAPVERSTVASHHEGVSTPISTARYVVVDLEGRVIEEYSAGRIDQSGDETRVTRRYATGDATRWIRDRVCEETTYDSDGTTVLASARHYFGGPGAAGIAIEPWCTVGLGLARRSEAWLAEDNRWVTRTETDYDARWNPVRLVAEGVERALTYDATGEHLIGEVIAPGDLALGYTMTWDLVRDLPLTATDPSGVETRVAYDPLGRISSVALGANAPHVHYVYDWTAPRPTTRTYAFAGDVTQTPVFPGSYVAGQWREQLAAANGAGEPLFEAVRADANRWIISGWRERDARGRTTEVVDAFHWDASSLVGAAAPAPPHPRQTVRYDAYDRVVQQVLPTGAQKSVSHAAFGTTVTSDDLAPVTSELDGQGRIRRTARVVNGATESVTATYDGLGRITSMRLNEGQPSTLEHSFVYDSLGRMIFATDPDIGDRTLVYDDADRLIEHVNGANQSIAFGYDSAGRLTTRSAAGVSFAYHYDVAQTPATFARTAGRLAWVQEPTGIVQLGYDVLGRPAHVRRTVNGQTADEVSTISAAGDLLAIDYLDGVALGLAYDDAGRLIELKRGTETLWALDAQDPAGRILAEHFGNNVSTTYARDELGQPSEIRITRSATPPAPTELYRVLLERNAYGAITSVTDIDGTGLDHTATFSYDAGARLTAATLGTSSSQHVFSYAYDGLQNMISRAGGGNGTLIGQYVYGEPAMVGGPSRGPRQLTSVVTSSGTVTFDYDAAGRQIRQGTIQLEYDGLDQLVRVTGVPGASGDVVHGYGYDGLRVFTQDPSGATQVWFTPNLSQTDGARDHYVRIGDRLIARIKLDWIGEAGGANTGGSAGAVVERSTTDRRRMLGAPLLTFVLGLLAWMLARRLMRAAPTVWRHRWRMLPLPLASVVAAVGCGLFSSTEQAVWQVQAPTYYHQGIGAGPTLMTRSDGTILEERRYEPFGDDLDAYREPAGGGVGMLGVVDFTTDPHAITNKPADPTTGWSYHGTRWMAPETARWLTPDPPVKAPDPKFMASPWSMHPYQYVEQNPIVFWDPDGREPESVQAEMRFWDESYERNAWWRESVRGKSINWIAGISNFGGRILDNTLGRVQVQASCQDGCGEVVAEDGVFYDVKGDAGRTFFDFSTTFLLSGGAAWTKGGSALRSGPIVRPSWWSITAGSLNSLRATALGSKLLKSGVTIPLGNTKAGLMHILVRHSFRSGAQNVSRFQRAMGHQEIKSLIHEATAGTTAWRVEGTKRVLDASLGRAIGTDQAGNAVSGLRVVTDTNGSVITAYPIGL